MLSALLNSLRNLDVITRLKLSLAFIALTSLTIQFDHIIQKNNLVSAFEALNSQLAPLTYAIEKSANKLSATAELRDIPSFVIAELDQPELIHDIKITNSTGEYFALNKGNPAQGLLVTQEDSDHASEALLLNQYSWWRHYYISVETNDVSFWSHSSETNIVTMVSPFESQTDVFPNLMVVDIDLTNIVAHYSNQIDIFGSSDTNLIEKKKVFLNLTNTYNDRWHLIGSYHFPWLVLTVPFVFSALIWLFIRKPNKKLVQLAKNYEHFIPVLNEELSVIFFETNAQSIVTWKEGSLNRSGSIFNIQVGDAVKEVLTPFPRYLTYWQQTFYGAKMTYEFQDEESTIRIHQRPIFDDKKAVVGMSVLVRDISEFRQIEEQLRHQQLHDELTGLPNRQLFMEQLFHEIQRSKRRQEFLAVLALEVNGIGHINKSYGHEVSDKIIKLTADALTETLRSEDTLCRFSNDEFLICCNDYKRPDELKAVAERLIEHASEPQTIQGHELRLFANVGIATFPRDARDGGSLVSNAIAAMRHARQTGRNCLDYFSEDNARLAQEKWQIEQDITKALHAHEFELHYQPIFSLEKNLCVGAEALIRWPRTDLRPDQFIPLAEESGLIHTIGLWVIESAIRQFTEWKAEGHGLQYLSVNLSVIQLNDDQFFPKLEKILSNYSLENGQLILEITESIMMQTDPATIAQLQKLKAMGFGLAIDDFGTGFSSLNYLKHLPVNILKIDRSFIHGIQNEAHDRAICEAIIQMAGTMDLKIIAEGVETPEQLSWLIDKGVTTAQGYFYAKPVSADNFIPYLPKQNPTHDSSTVE